MELILFIVFLALSLLLIILGFYRTEHTELSVIGFVFLFLLAGLILSNGLTYQTGFQKNITYSYDAANTTLLAASEVSANTYGSLDIGSTLSHLIGYWLSVVAIVGFIGVIISARRPKDV